MAGGAFCPGNGRYRAATISFTCGTTIGAPFYVSENLCHYQFAWATIYACEDLPPPPPTPTPPAYLNFRDLVAHFDAGSTARMTVDSELCTGGLDFTGGLSLLDYTFVDRGTVGNDYSYLTFGLDSLVRHATRGFVRSVTTINVLEYQAVEISRDLVDPVSYKAVESRNYTCKYGEVTDGAVFHLA